MKYPFSANDHIMSQWGIARGNVTCKWANDMQLDRITVAIDKCKWRTFETFKALFERISTPIIPCMRWRVQSEEVQRETERTFNLENAFVITTLIKSPVNAKSSSRVTNNVEAVSI